MNVYSWEREDAKRNRKKPNNEELCSVAYKVHPLYEPWCVIPHVR
jgi:hypothetical protein